MKEVLLVTGSSGIAAATARLWGTENPVFVVGINSDECEAVAGNIREGAFAAADVCDERTLRAAVLTCLERFGRIDALFNVAGISARSAGDGPLHECKPGAWDLAMDVNAKGTFLMCREILDLWTKNKQAGVILNCGSVLAQQPQSDHFATVAYAASKGAIEAMSKSAAAYYAHAGIRINVLAPGLVRTPMSARAQRDPRIAEYIAHKQPLTKGMLSPDDVARAACFLLRRDSSPITGQVVTVDGGWTVSA
ncbi:MAG: dehydrogenase [Acidobacteria bacterium]|nr:MAG: dehydrogenase [Acidobacteriota bacterium]